jgi:hypothetical protein
VISQAEKEALEWLRQHRQPDERSAAAAAMRMGKTETRLLREAVVDKRALARKRSYYWQAATHLGCLVAVECLILLLMWCGNFPVVRGIDFLGFHVMGHAVSVLVHFLIIGIQFDDYRRYKC